MHDDPAALRNLVIGMRAAYARGENVMAWARAATGGDRNSALAILIAYDLQAGTYSAAARSAPDVRAKWCAEMAELLAPSLTPDDSVLEVGCGEATTLAGVLQRLPQRPREALGFDISWSRCREGGHWLAQHRVHARLFVADLFHIPLADSSIDVVYTSHSLEPNGGMEEAAIRELLRVARKEVVLVEPIYELASAAGRERMAAHGYVRGLKAAAEKQGAVVVEHRLLELLLQPLNPSGVIRLRKDDGTVGVDRRDSIWQCPLTGVSLAERGEAFFGQESGLAYPVMKGVPLLRPEHAVVASAFDRSFG